MSVMRSFLSKRIRVTLAKEAIPEWFKQMTGEQQDMYLEEHPNSKLAKSFRSKKPDEVNNPKIKVKKKDPYLDVPEEDRKTMIAAKERGFTVPPAWREVWLNPDPEGDLQVKGKDKKGRTQSLYSVNFRTQQDALKFERLKDFTNEYPEMAKRMFTDLDKNPTAQCLYLISKTGFRIGSEKDTGAEVKAYGASTLTSDHIKIEGNTIHFDFIGKEGVHQQHSLEDPKLARILKNKEGKLFDTSTNKLHKYLDNISTSHYKVKDFRTFVATTTALQACKNVDPPPPPKNKKDYEKAVMQVCKVVSTRLGNTPKMARDSYISPDIFKPWLNSLVYPESFEFKEQSFSNSENRDIQDLIETTHYQYPEQLILRYKKLLALPMNEERKKRYIEFQKLAKSLKLVDTKNKSKYIKTLRGLESILKQK